MYPDITFQQYIFMINMRDIGLLCFVIEIKKNLANKHQTNIKQTSNKHQTKQTSNKHKRSAHDTFLE